MAIKNKKADIAITILVIAVVVLCAATLFGFYVTSGKIGRTINSAYAIEDTYNLAESINYSEISIDKYNENSYSVKNENGEIVIEKTFYKKDLGIVADNEKEVLKINYRFKT